MGTKKKSRTVTKKGINGKTKTESTVKELLLKDELGIKVGRLGKSKGRDEAAVLKITEMETFSEESNMVKISEATLKRKRGADKTIVEESLLSSEKGSLRLRPRKEVPEFKMVELGDKDGKQIIGKRVKVYWPDSRKWFLGRVKAFNSKKKLHAIDYEDGDKEDLDLNQERFLLELMPGENFIEKVKPKSEKKKKNDPGSDHT